jgi:hypothetical protein
VGWFEGSAAAGVAGAEADYRQGARELKRQADLELGEADSGVVHEHEKSCSPGLFDEHLRFAALCAGPRRH